MQVASLVAVVIEIKKGVFRASILNEFDKILENKYTSLMTRNYVILKKKNGNR